MSEEQKLEIEKGLAEIVSEDTVEYETLMKMHRKWEKLFFQKTAAIKLEKLLQHLEIEWSTRVK